MTITEQIKVATSMRRNVEREMSKLSGEDEETAKMLTEEHAGIIAIIETLRTVRDLAEKTQFLLGLN